MRDVDHGGRKGADPGRSSALEGDPDPPEPRGLVDFAGNQPHGPTDRLERAPATSTSALMPEACPGQDVVGRLGIEVDRAVLDDAKQSVGTAVGEGTQAGGPSADDPGHRSPNLGAGDPDVELAALRLLAPLVGLSHRERATGACQLGFGGSLAAEARWSNAAWDMTPASRRLLRWKSACACVSEAANWAMAFCACAMAASARAKAASLSACSASSWLRSRRARTWPLLDEVAILGQDVGDPQSVDLRSRPWPLRAPRAFPIRTAGPGTSRRFGLDHGDGGRKGGHGLLDFARRAGTIRRMVRRELRPSGRPSPLALRAPGRRATRAGTAGTKRSAATPAATNQKEDEEDATRHAFHAGTLLRFGATGRTFPANSAANRPSARAIFRLAVEANLRGPPLEEARHDGEERAQREIRVESGRT